MTGSKSEVKGRDKDDSWPRGGGKKHKKEDTSEHSSSSSDDSGKKAWVKPVMVKRGATGKVKWFNLEKAFGFINVDGEEGESVFVHASSIVTIIPGLSCALAEGEPVEFDIIEGVKGREAIAITSVGGMKAGIRRSGPRFSGSMPPTHRNRPLRSAFDGDYYGDNVAEHALVNAARKKLSIRDDGGFSRSSNNRSGLGSIGKLRDHGGEAESKRASNEVFKIHGKGSRLNSANTHDRYHEKRRQRSTSDY